ncbi:helix-turn-helix domain-containing protein [Nonomuraea sp. CA-143628]|uniref:helix-turn-helix domain-containing protein n=1 Tax=Nonomuraea sp. CA-143628 TaxID=3239997 RepID=UPI003D8A388B
MSYLSSDWAMYYAPVKSPTEKLVLVALARRTDDDGCDAYKSKATLAQAAMCDPKTVQRVLRELEERGLIKLGDQAVAEYIDPRYRPIVYDIQIPFVWFSAAQMEQVNAERARKGRPALQPDDRPDLPPAPERPSRSDKGKKAPQRRPRSIGPRDQQEEGSEVRGDSESPLPDGDGPRGDSESQPGGILNPARGDSESPNSFRELPSDNSSVQEMPPSSASPAGEAKQEDLLGDDTPPPAATAKKTTRPSKAKKERTPEEQLRFEQATKVAQWWWDECDKAGVPKIGRSATGTGFPGLVKMLETALADNYTQREIADALRSRRKRFPHLSVFEDALMEVRGIAPVRPLNRNQTPGNHLAPYNPDDAANNENRKAWG